MSQPADQLCETPSQTAGPYVHIGCTPSFVGIGVYPGDLGAAPAGEGAKGERIRVSGVVLDGAGAPLCDAMIETWQADSAGLYPGQNGADPAVGGFGRIAVDGGTGEWALRTVKPGAVHGRAGSMAPHISLWIVARGINIGLHTRMLFDDEDNSGDPLLARIDPPDRAETLIARKTGEGAYRFDIRLQGAGETVFLDM